MADYTYPPAPVFVETTGELAIGATGVLRTVDGVDPIPVYDLNDSPLPSILVGPKGAHQAFKADIAEGVLDFGSVLLPTISLEQYRAALTVVGVANQAAADAAAALSLAQQASAGAAANLVVHGNDPNVARPALPYPVIWYGTVEPLNMLDGDVYNIIAAES